MSETKIILKLAAVATFVIGLATLIAPELLIKIFDGNGSESAHFVRFIGTALIGFSVMNWLYASYDVKAVRPAIIGNLTSLSLAILVDVIGLSLHLLKPLTFVILITHLVFAVAFGYCLKSLSS